jgi:hypothetical protein
VGHGLPRRPLVDRRPGVRRQRASAAPPWRHARARAVLPRSAVAIHERVGAPRLGQGQRTRAARVAA